MKEKSSPRINSVSWGTLEVEEVGRLKDAKLWPGGGRNGDWNETGTRHRPGVQPADLEELLEAGARSVIIGQGDVETTPGSGRNSCLAGGVRRRGEGPSEQEGRGRV